MESQYFDSVIKEMEPFIEENGFLSTEKGVYSNDKKSFKVAYDDNRKMFVLTVADIDEENNIGEYSEIDAWLFDETQTADDAVSVGMDFVDVLKKNMGIKNKAKTSFDIDLPTSDSEKYGVSAFTKKALDTYPQLKDTYKAYVAKYGTFLYLNFFGEYLVPLIANTVNEAGKKSGKKILDMVEPAFIKGDNDASNAAIACLAAVCVKYPDSIDRVSEILSENAALKTSVLSFANTLKNNKKLKAVLVK